MASSPDASWETSAKTTNNKAWVSYDVVFMLVESSFGLFTDSQLVGRVWCRIVCCAATAGDQAP